MWIVKSCYRFFTHRACYYLNKGPFKGLYEVIYGICYRELSKLL